jgi:uncharacterized protein YbjT (DUF2867 family)
MTTRKALIVGATGLIGNYCLQNLLEDAYYSEVTVLVRKPTQNLHPKLKAVVTDFNNLDQVSSQIRVDDVFCCLGTTIKKAGSQKAFRTVDYSLVVTIAKIMQRQGAQQFVVVSAMGASKDSKVFYNRIKGEMEDTLIRLGYPCLRIVRPSLLLGARKEFRLGEKFAMLLSPLLSPLLFGSLKKYKPVEASSVARFMVQISREEPVAGVHVYESDVLTRMR